VEAFPDGKSALMLAAARLRYMASSKWGTRRYLNMNRLAEESEAAWTRPRQLFGSPPGEPEHHHQTDPSANVRKTLDTTLQSLQTGAMDQAQYLQLSRSLDGFRSKLRARAKTLNVCERQQIVRLLIKEILVDDKNPTICHSIPISPVTPTPKHAHRYQAPLPL
jgi:hypothetical protein